MNIYNTLTRRKESFTPLVAGRIGMYVCGVTVYDLCHVGHARSAIVFDVIRRYLTWKGYQLRFVKNYTDIDDKIIRRANQAGVPASELSARYIRAFQEDMAAIGVLPADIEPKATAHVSQMIALIEHLVAEGFAYVVDGDVYFEIRRFPPYGRLSGRNLDELLAGARVDVDERKRDPRDFALWKSAKPGEPAWESRWGPGRPGWHIECSAMSMAYLGETFDIHGGGEDLIFPHHECEIAQSEAWTKQPLAHYWIHNGFVNLGAEKMSKSLGNTLTIREIVKRHEPDALRLWLLGTHYRSPIEFASARLTESLTALKKLRNVVMIGWNRAYGPDISLDPPSSLRGERSIEERVRRVRDGELRREIEDLVTAFVAAMDDDFNTPRALGALFNLASAANVQSDRVDRLLTTGDRSEGTRHAVEDFLCAVAVVWGLSRMLGLLDHGVDRPKRHAEHDEKIAELVELREDARRRRDWKRADEIRAQLDELGLVVDDTPSGPRVKSKSL